MGDIVIDNAKRFPDASAYRVGSRAVSHRELLDRGTQLASAMVAAGEVVKTSTWPVGWPGRLKESWLWPEAGAPLACVRPSSASGTPRPK